MAKYVRKNGQWLDPITGEPMPVPERDGVVMPFIVSDIPEYASPIDGRPITSRSHRREDLKRNNCIPYEPSMKPKHPKFEAFEERRKRAMRESA